MNLALQGIVPPLVTPLRGRDELDLPGLERLVEHVIGGGVDGLFLLGTTGEAPSLSYRLRRELIQRVAKLVAGRLPILVGITDTAFVESVNLARYAAECGAAAVVLTTPYYFPAGQTELASYVEHILEELPLPLVLYNMPSMTKVWFEIETVRQLAAHRQIIGIKDSSGDLDYFARLTSLREQQRPDWSIMMGPEAFVPQAMRLGAQGAVTGGANVIPRVFVECYQALAGDEARLGAAQDTIIALQQIYEIGKYPSRYIKGTKCCLSLLNICDDFMAEPFHRFRAPQREKVRACLRQMRLLAD